MDRLTANAGASSASGSDRVSGVVQWYCPARGFGYIAPSDGGEDVYVAFGDLPPGGFRCLSEGQQVSYLLDDDGRGPVARDVQPSFVAVA